MSTSTDVSAFTVVKLVPPAIVASTVLLVMLRTSTLSALRVAVVIRAFPLILTPLAMSPVTVKPPSTSRLPANIGIIKNLALT